MSTTVVKTNRPRPLQRDRGHASIAEVDAGDLEGTAEALRRFAGVAEDEAAATSRVAVKCLGDDAIEVVGRHRMRAPAKLARVGGAWRIFVKQGLSAEELNFFVGHELGEWFLMREGYAGEDVEHCANYIGAALVAPRRPFIEGVRAIGEDWSELARRFTATESLCVLRWGEILRQPLSLVTPLQVRVRGPDSFVWPDETTIRRWASGRPGPGLRKARLADDRRRVVLVADELEDVG